MSRVSARAISTVLGNEGFPTVPTVPTTRKPGIRVKQDGDNASIIVVLAKPKDTEATVREITTTLAERGYTNTYNENIVTVTGKTEPAPTGKGQPEEEAAAEVTQEQNEEPPVDIEPEEIPQPTALAAFSTQGLSAVPNLDQAREAIDNVMATEFNPDWAPGMEKEAAAILGFTVEELNQARADRDFRKRYSFFEGKAELTTAGVAAFLGVQTEDVERLLRNLLGRREELWQEQHERALADAANKPPQHPDWLETMRCVAGFPWEEHGVDISEMDDWGPKLAAHIQENITW